MSSDVDGQEILYEVGGRSGSIYWVASEYFGELSGKKYELGRMEATVILARDDLSEVGKILLSAVAGATIQYLIDAGVSVEDIFQRGVMEIVR